MKKIFISAIICFLAMSQVFSQSILLTPNQLYSKQVSNTDNLVLRGINPPNLVGIQHAGTIATPSATTLNSTLIGLQGEGFNGTSITPTKVGIAFTTTENWTSTANGTNMQFFTTANGTTTLTERMRIENNGYVGIGTNAPAEKLTVQTTTNSYGLLHTDGTISLGTSTISGAGGAFGTKSNHPLYFRTNDGFPQMALLVNGKVGIGTTAPTEILTVQTTSGNYGLLQTDGTVSLGTVVTDGIGGLFGTKSNHPLFFFTNSNFPQMALLQNGKVGIGTTAPTEMLTVQTATNSLGITHTDGTIALSTYVGGSGAGGYFGTKSNHPLYFMTNNGAAQIALLQNGNVGIGTTTPHAPLQFPNVAANRKIVLYENANNDQQYYGFGINGSTLRYQTPDVSTDHVFFAGVNTTTSNELMRIKGTGDVVVAGYTQLGNSVPAGADASATVPIIKTLKLTGTTAATQGGFASIKYGEILDAKFLSYTVLIDVATQFITPNSTIPTFQYDTYVSCGEVIVHNSASNSSGILSVPIRILIIYEE